MKSNGNGTQKYYKAAKPDGWDFYTGKTINYRDSVGHIVKCPSVETPVKLCSSSVLHASKEPTGVFIGAKIPCSVYVVQGTPVINDTEKSGFKQIEVLYEIPQTNLNKLFGFNYLEACNPIHPFKIEPPEIRTKQIELLRQWASVRDSAGDSVWASVWDSVRASVWASARASVWASVWDSAGASVWDSVRDSAGASVRDSVWAYIGSLFLKIVTWKYCETIKISGYPFQSAVKLWKLGIVPSYDGTIWRLHTKNGIAWEGQI
jgi:hypothetical protein